MVSKGEEELIIDYALQNEDNLKIIISIMNSFDKIREKIIVPFLEAFEKTLQESLNDKWLIKNELKENLFELYKGFYIFRNDWKGDYSIGFSCERRLARGFIIGVAKNDKIEPIGGGKLKEVLDENYIKGLASKNWEWYRWLEPPYLNWDNEDVLIKMLFKKEEAVNYFREHLLRIKEIASPLIDEAVITNRH